MGWRRPSARTTSAQAAPTATGWVPLDEVARDRGARARWIARIAAGEAPARLDPETGAVFVWGALTRARLDALLAAGVHARLPALVDARAALPELCARLAARTPRGRGERIAFPTAAARRAA